MFREKKQSDVNRKVFNKNNHNKVEKNTSIKLYTHTLHIILNMLNPTLFLNILVFNFLTIYVNFGGKKIKLYKFYIVFFHIMFNKSNNIFFIRICALLVFWHTNFLSGLSRCWIFKLLKINVLYSLLTWITFLWLSANHNLVRNLV